MPQNKPASYFQREHDLSLPIEDSQDLFNTAPANAPTSLSPNGLSLHLTPLEDSQFPHQESHKKIDSVAMLRLDFSNIGGSQEKDDLLGLCSGKFTGLYKNVYDNVKLHMSCNYILVLNEICVYLCTSRCVCVIHT